MVADQAFIFVVPLPLVVVLLLLIALFVVASVVLFRTKYRSSRLFSYSEGT